MPNTLVEMVCVGRESCSTATDPPRTLSPLTLHTRAPILGPSRCDSSPARHRPSQPKCSALASFSRPRWTCMSPSRARQSAIKCLRTPAASDRRIPERVPPLTPPLERPLLGSSFCGLWPLLTLKGPPPTPPEGRGRRGASVGHHTVKRPTSSPTQKAAVEVGFGRLEKRPSD